MSKSGYKQWEITKEGLSKMTWTLGNLMKQNQNHIYRVIVVRQIVLDSDIFIYKFVRVGTERVILVQLCIQACISCENCEIFSSHSKFGWWYCVTGGRA